MSRGPGASGRRLATRLLATRLLAATALAWVALGPAALPALAAEPVVGVPTTTVAFLQSITFQSSATLSSDVTRIELVVDIEGSTRSIVTDVPTPGPGAATLSQAIGAPGGSIVPGTDVTGHFRLTMADGSVIEGPSATLHYDDTRFAWKTTSGDFMRVHYTDGGVAFGKRAARIGDDAIRQISALLGVTESYPIDFYIYSDRTAFYDVLGAGSRENIGGVARPEIRTLFANIAPTAIDDPWVGIVIPHELTHLVFDTATKNPYHEPVHWLNEGIAVYLSESYGAADRAAVRNAVQTGGLMPLQGLTGEFPTTAERFSLAYSEAVSAVSFLVDTYGRDALVALVRSYAKGVTDDEAFTAALGTDTAGFEAAWLAANGAAVPSPYGPLDAPAGPVPSGWGGAAPTAGEGPTASPAPDRSANPVSGPGQAGADTVAQALVALLAVVIVMVVLVWRLSRAAHKPGAAHPEPEPPADEPAPADVPDPPGDEPPPGSAP